MRILTARWPGLALVLSLSSMMWLPIGWAKGPSSLLLPPLFSQCESHGRLSALAVRKSDTKQEKFPSWGNLPIYLLSHTSQIEPPSIPIWNLKNLNNCVLLIHYNNYLHCIQYIVYNNCGLLIHHHNYLYCIQYIVYNNFVLLIHHHNYLHCTACFRLLLRGPNANGSGSS